MTEALGGELELRRLHRPQLALLERLAAYEQEAFGDTGLRSFDLNVVAYAGALLVGFADEQVAACCQLVRTVDDPGVMWVVGFWVRPPWQGRGFGRRLLSFAAEQGRSAGAPRLLLTADPKNEAALNLYFSFGFYEAERILDFYGRGRDRLLLRFEPESG